MKEIDISMINEVSGGIAEIETNIKISVFNEDRLILNDLIFYSDAVCTSRKCINDIFDTEITAYLGFTMNGKSEVNILASPIEGGATYSIY